MFFLTFILAGIDAMAKMTGNFAAAFFYTAMSVRLSDIGKMAGHAS
jgi:hypothetical protein